ncbi:MAG TPA: alpha/beta fold hydrolase [Solirubrobacteraceae bacterium]|nr:alpha/beta fold hydrolase [Solirubrobacteraceae bacterium]
MPQPRLHLSETTTGSAPREPARPVVLIHGVGDRSESWGGVIDRLPPGLDVVTYDLRGHGDSDKPPGPYSLDDFVTDHVSVLDSLGIERCHVVGFSLGGMIAQAIALTRPETVDRLVLVSCVAGRTEREREAVLARLAVVENEGPGGTAKVSGARWFTDGFIAAHPEAVERRLAELAANDPVGYAAAYRVLATNDLADELSAIDAPTLIITGEHDIGSPPHMAQTMHERIPDSRLTILEGMRHSVLVEAPELIASQIGEFLRSDGDRVGSAAARVGDGERR